MAMPVKFRTVVSRSMMRRSRSTSLALYRRVPPADRDGRSRPLVFIQAQVLHPGAGEVSRHRDPVETASRFRHVGARFFCRHPCIPRQQY